MSDLLYGEVSLMPQNNGSEGASFVVGVDTNCVPLTKKCRVTIVVEDAQYRPNRYLYKDHQGNFHPYPFSENCLQIQGLNQPTPIYRVVQDSEVILGDLYSFFKEKDRSVVTSKMDFINRFYSLVNDVVKVTRVKTHISSDNFLDGVNLEFRISKEELSSDRDMDKLYGKIVNMLSK